MLQRLLLIISLLGTPAGADKQAPLNVLVMGDSLFSTHMNSERSVGDVLSKELNATLRNMPAPGARMIYNLPLTGAMGFSIPKQFRKGDWDWVVLNGGGNDVFLGCACARCERKINKMINEDGSDGVIPKLITRLRDTGARVVYVGYLRSPGINTPIENCKDEGDMLEARIAKLAQQDEGVDFLSLQDLVPDGDLTYHGWDRIHPSPKASRAIANLVLDVIKRAD